MTYASDLQHDAIDEAYNTAFITILHDQPFEQVLALAHQTHQRFVQMLRAQDENIFVPDNAAYERLQRVIDHHLQHAQELEAANSR